MWETKIHNLCSVEKQFHHYQQNEQSPLLIIKQKKNQLNRKKEKYKKQQLNGKKEKYKTIKHVKGVEKYIYKNI